LFPPCYGLCELGRDHEVIAYAVTV
jgi:hypothetical protein